MSETVITVSDAARNLAEYVKQAQFENAEFLLVEDGVPCAKIVPARGKPSRASDLRAALAEVKLSDDEARAWMKDIQDGRKMLLPPVDRWE